MKQFFNILSLWKCNIPVSNIIMSRNLLSKANVPAQQLLVTIEAKSQLYSQKRKMETKPHALAVRACS